MDRGSWWSGFCYGIVVASLVYSSLFVFVLLTTG